MKIYLGADHGGFALKEKIKHWLLSNNYEVEDCGAFELDPEDDYTDFSFAVAEKVSADKTNNSRGILICRSGAGAVIAANKVKRVRAANVQNATAAQHARNDNNANVIGLAGDWISEAEIEPTIQVFLDTPFSDAERHRRRVQKIIDYENCN